MRIAEVKNIVRAVGKRNFPQVLSLLLEGRDAAGQQVPKIRPEQVSFQALYEALVGPVADIGVASMGPNNFIEIQEAVESTAFPSATGVLIAQKVMDGYMAGPTVGDMLCTVMPSKLRQERIVGFTSLEGPTEVAEGMPYQESSFREKYVTTEATKKGRILEVTEETITFDQTGQILMRASRLGEQTREERELTILAGVVDVGSSAAGYKDSYKPSGTATALYSAANTNYLSTATPLVDWTDVDEVLQYAAENIRDDRASAAEQLPIFFNAKVLLTARKKAATSGRIVRATTVRSGQVNTDPANQMETSNPIDTIAPGMVPIATPLLDYLANLTGSRYDDSDDWFIGDPQKQFVWQEIWPVQTMRARQDDEAAFRRDIVARFKVRYFGALATIDTKYFVKVNAV